MTQTPEQPPQQPSYTSGQGWAPPPPPPPGSGATNGLAIASLVCGLLWGGGILSLLALIFGIIAVRQIGRSGSRGRGMAIAGIILGAAGIVLTILAAVALVAAVDEFGEELDVDRPATVAIETSTPEVCWEAEVVTGRRIRDGSVENLERGCGAGRLDLGLGFLRVAEIRKTSGTGTVTAVLSIDGTERQRDITDGAEPITITPFEQLPGKGRFGD